MHYMCKHTKRIVLANVELKIVLNLKKRHNTTCKMFMLLLTNDRTENEQRRINNALLLTRRRLYAFTAISLVFCLSMKDKIY